MTPDQLVDEALALEAQIRDKQQQLSRTKAELIKLGAGEYHGAAGGKALVICPKASIRPTDGLIADVKAALDKSTFGKLFDRQESHRIAEDGLELAQAKLKPELFKAIFTRVVAYKPVKAFREVAAALLSKKQATELIEACEVPQDPYVKLTAP